MKPAPIDTPTFLKTVAAWVYTNLGPAARSKTRSISIRIGDEFARLLIPADGEAVDDALEFEPTATQEAILLALRDGEMKTDRLAGASGLNKSQLFEKGRGLEQLRNAGLVDHKLRAGYFLTEPGERLVALLVKDD